MTTKERIVEEALTLFAQKGYKGTSVKNIADAVNIKDSSLYKHFKSKQEILDTITEKIEKHILETTKYYGLPSGENFAQVAKAYQKMDGSELAKISKEIFLFYLKDDLLSRFWKMGNIEQFQNNEVRSIFRKFFFEDSIKYQTALFEEMSRQKIFIEVDPQIMAVSFYTPIYFLLCKYSGIAEKEQEALAILDKQVREFYRIYHV